MYEYHLNGSMRHEKDKNKQFYENSEKKEREKIKMMERDHSKVKTVM